jgi:hypothetical protein
MGLVVVGLEVNPQKLYLFPPLGGAPVSGSVRRVAVLLPAAPCGLFRLQIVGGESVLGSSSAGEGEGEGAFSFGRAMVTSSAGSLESAQHKVGE